MGHRGSPNDARAEKDVIDNTTRPQQDTAVVTAATEVGSAGAITHGPEAVVSVLSGYHGEQVATLWAELRREFNVTGVYETPVPHISYHVAENYEADTLDDVLQDFARTWAPFHITTAGLGLFSGPQPVLYIAVVRDAHLAALQEQIVRRLGPIAHGPICHYLPENWLPHITLTIGHVNHDMLAAITAYLCRRSLHWRIPIDNLAIICDNCGVRGVTVQYALRGKQEGAEGSTELR